MKTLYLECAMGASGDMLMGALVSLLDAPEEFIAEMNALGVPGVQKGFTPSAAASVPKDAVPAIFEVGDRVMHRKFGEGNVLEIRGSGSDARIVISFTAYGSKEFALSIAPIVKVVD